MPVPASAQEKQWKQLGQDANGLRLQLKFVRRTHGLKTGFIVADIRATIPTVSGHPSKRTHDVRSLVPPEAPLVLRFWRDRRTLPPSAPPVGMCRWPLPLLREARRR